MLEISAFLIVLYIAGIGCKKVGVSPVIGEMLVGVFFGPNSPIGLKDFLPFADFFILAGDFGVTLMIFESGMHLNFDMIKKVGGKAFVVAILGTFLPIAFGIAVMIAFGFEIWPTGLSVGVALAPTSVGMALKMLGEKKQLDAEFGQLIVTAAFIDDIFSLVALTMLLQIGTAQQSGDSLSPWSILEPLVYSILFCSGGALMAYPMDRSGPQSFVKKYLLCWVGIFPRFIPYLIETITDILHDGPMAWLKSRKEPDMLAVTSPTKSVSFDRTPPVGRPSLDKVPEQPAANSGEVALAERSQADIDAFYTAGRHRENSPSIEDCKLAATSDVRHAIAAGKYAKGMAMKDPGRSSFHHVNKQKQLMKRRHSTHFTDHYGEGRHQHQDIKKFYVEDRVLLTLMFCLLLAYGYVSAGIGSHLLGAFIAGVSFCWMEDHAGLILWHSQMKRIEQWLIRLFFGATVAFSIPIDKMLSFQSFWRGFLLGIGPCIGTKIGAGVFTGADRWVVGFAMVGRGEFAYLVAQTAQDLLLNPAPSEFDPYGLVEQPGGYWCYQDDCVGDGSSSGGRMLSGGGDAVEEIEWCKFSDESAMSDADGHAIAGLKYWQVGEACDSHADECSCELMLSAEAYSIAVWALVMASVLAPIGFGIVLNKRLISERANPAADLDDLAVGGSDNIEMTLSDTSVDQKTI
jgi:Kef-type K+ transport system membrane component KefB